MFASMPGDARVARVQKRMSKLKQYPGDNVPTAVHPVALRDAVKEVIEGEVEDAAWVGARCFLSCPHYLFS